MKSRLYTLMSIYRGYLIRNIRHSESEWALRKRYRVYSSLFRDCGSHVRITSGVFIDYPQNVSMGDRVSIQPNCYISAYGGLKLGSDVSIGTGTYIFTSHHPYEEGIIRDNPLETRPVVIGNNVWIGAGVRILGGSVVRDHTVIGAGAVVCGELVAGGVYAGNPAKLVKNIKSYEGTC